MALTLLFPIACVCSAAGSLFSGFGNDKLRSIPWGYVISRLTLRVVELSKEVPCNSRRNSKLFSKKSSFVLSAITLDQKFFLLLCESNDVPFFSAFHVDIPRDRLVGIVHLLFPRGNRVYEQ